MKVVVDERNTGVDEPRYNPPSTAYLSQLYDTERGLVTTPLSSITALFSAEKCLCHRRLGN